tara:strand:- start:89 stop:373 length:285 start_codon:yes stop_codon:yes gene_type:complete
MAAEGEEVEVVLEKIADESTKMLLELEEWHRENGSSYSDDEYLKLHAFAFHSLTTEQYPIISMILSEEYKACIEGAIAVAWELGFRYASKHLTN